MPGNQGGSNWGSTAGNPGDGRVYVIGFNVPTIIRLLKPGETRPARGARPEEIVKEGLSDDRRVRALPDDRQAALHDADRLRPEHRRDRLAEGARRRPAPAAARASPGTGSAATVKGGLIVTGTGLLFATAADRKVHVYDTGNGTELATLPLGGPTSGGPSMYEHGGRQYLLVHGVGGAADRAGRRADAAQGPDGPRRLRAAALTAARQLSGFRSR